MSRRWVGLLLLGLGVRLILAWLPIDVLITRTLPDDAFIYFVISRNLAAGLGATFDGLRPTNGFHPLWPLLTAPFFWLNNSGDLPIHLSLTLAAVCDALAGGLTAWVIGHITQNRSAGDWSLALYLLNPRVIQESVNGLETSLGMLALAGCLAAWVWAMAQPTHKGRGALFGLTVALTLLARSDLVIVSGLLFAAYVWRGRRVLVAPLIAAGVAVLGVAPWFAWSQLRVGTVVQSSGVAIPSLVAARIQTISDPTLLWNSLLFPIINFSFRDVIIYPGIAIMGAMLGLLLVRWPNRAAGAVPRPSINLNKGLWWPLIGAALIVGIHTFIRWYPRGWYFVPLAWAWALIAGPMLAVGLTAPAGRRFGWMVIGLMGFVIVVLSLKMAAEPEYAWQSDMQSGAAWLQANTPRTEIVGAFNAGIYSYYSERRILNLDGLVDWGAITARQQGRLLDYFVERGGTLIIEHEAYIESFSGYFGSRHLEPIQSLPVKDPAYGPIRIYQVISQ